MDETLPWYRAMPAEQRSWVGLVAQAGIAAFVEWFRHPEQRRAITGEIFGTAPRELARTVSLQQTVEMVRITIGVVEAAAATIAGPENAAELREAVLIYAREVPSLEKRTRGASDRVERMLGEPDGGGLYSCIDKRWPSRLRGGVVASMFCAEGGVVMGDVSMCS
jgi:hypothetical protein